MGEITKIQGDLIMRKEEGVGLKIDTDNPDYGWRDLEGVEFVDILGSLKPSVVTYSGGILKENSYSNNDVLRIRFHIPHDYVPGTDLYIHVHWSHNGTAISGDAVFTCTSDYAKGHDQAAFGTEKSVVLTYSTVDIATTPQYQHMITEVAMTSDGGSATLIDNNDIEIDGLILMNCVMTTNPSITGGDDVFIHRVDIHYQSTNLPTKNKAPNFYS